MPRFQTLTHDELRELESEFVEFLSVQGITADDWVKIKETNPDRTMHFIDQFSDVVYGSVMLKIKYLEYRTRTALHAFHCGDSHIVLMAMESELPETDFTDPLFLQRATVQPPPDLKVYTSQKPYEDTREDEIFRMLANGCTATDGQLYELLKSNIK